MTGAQMLPKISYLRCQAVTLRAVLMSQQKSIQVIYTKKKEHSTHYLKLQTEVLDVSDGCC